MRMMCIESGSIEERIFFSNKTDEAYFLEKTNEFRDILCNILENPDLSTICSLESCFTPEVMEEYKIKGDDSVVMLVIDGMPKEFKEYLENNHYFKFNDDTEDRIVTTISKEATFKGVKRCYCYLLHSDFTTFSTARQADYWLVDDKWVEEQTERIRVERKSTFEKMLNESMTIEQLYKWACGQGFERAPLVLNYSNIDTKEPITIDILSTAFSPGHVCINIEANE